ncbi:MAG: phytanoyl-CoA dioxygenase family protein [Gammaproteobacteria bacterium]|nr:phytanoyl-CoA dioxygenase family protein [Gammaproteobacteria bacterium]
MQEDVTSSTSGDLPKVAEADTVVARLRAENAQLRAELARAKGDGAGLGVDGAATGDGSWQEAMRLGIAYADNRSSTSAASAGHLLSQLSGLSKERMKAGRIANSSDFDYLPRPSADEAQLEADFVRWGYCLVADAMSPSQVRAQVERLVAQAEAERQRDSAIMTSRNEEAQLVNNLVLKGQVFRDAVEFKESAAQRGPLVDRLLTKVMGEGFGLGCAHGSIVHEGGGLQELHIDQGGMPMPYPPFPFGSLIIWVYTEFNLANGATYVVPGSHRSAGGATLFRDGADLVQLVDGEPGLVAICAPAGTCILTDTRVLHCGGRRTAPGTRYAMRCHYNRHFIRALHEQSKANLHVPTETWERLSPRLKQMMGITVNDQSPTGELSGAHRTG